MSGIYRNKSGINMISGTVEAISPDRKEVTIKTTEGNRETHQLEDKLFKATFDGDNKLKDDIAVGDTITAAGYQNGQDSISAKYAEHANGCFKASDDLVIISGEVLFASYNAEKDENGNARLTQAGTEKKPHFDVTISVGQGESKVNHVVKVYNFDAKDGKAAQDNIGRFKKLFDKFDRKENPVYITLATSAGQEYTRTTTKGDKTYENKYESHLGFKSFNVQFLNSLNKDKAKTADAPAKDEVAKAADDKAENLDFVDIDAIDDMDLDF